MAKEYFEGRTLEGAINITLKDYPKPGAIFKWVADKGDLINKIIKTVDEYYQQNYRLTLRQLYYQLVSKEYIPNHDKVYKKLSTILDDCRYSGIIDWDMIEDRGRVPSIPYCNDSVEEALQAAANMYRLDRQLGQDVYIEVWTEKDAISGILSRVTREFHIHLVVNKGYIGSSAMYAAYQRFKEQFELGRHVRILYFGDHDPSGLDMVRDINDRLNFMFENGVDADNLVDMGYDFEVVPIGLTMKQIQQYNPPHNPAKITDPRAAHYVRQFGKMSWEVDSLAPPVMTAIVRTNILKLIDFAQYNEILDKEREDKKTITRLVGKIDEIKDDNDDEEQ